MCRHGGMKPTCTIFGLSSMKGRLIMGNNICKGTPPFGASELKPALTWGLREKKVERLVIIWPLIITYLSR